MEASSGHEESLPTSSSHATSDQKPQQQQLREVRHNVHNTSLHSISTRESKQQVTVQSTSRLQDISSSSSSRRSVNTGALPIEDLSSSSHHRKGEKKKKKKKKPDKKKKKKKKRDESLTSTSKRSATFFDATLFDEDVTFDDDLFSPSQLESFMSDDKQVEWKSKRNLVPEENNSINDSHQWECWDHSSARLNSDNVDESQGAFPTANAEKQHPGTPAEEEEDDGWGELILGEGHQSYHRNKIKDSVSGTPAASLQSSSSSSLLYEEEGPAQQTDEEDQINEEGLAEYHGEMLESFLKQNGQDEKLAVATAMAFESFLKSNSDLLHRVKHSARIDTTDTDNISDNDAGGTVFPPRISRRRVALDDDTFTSSGYGEEGTFASMPEQEQVSDFGHAVRKESLSAARRCSGTKKKIQTSLNLEGVAAGHASSSILRRSFTMVESSTPTERQQSDFSDSFSSIGTSGRTQSRQGGLIGVFRRGRGRDRRTSNGSLTSKSSTSQDQSTLDRSVRSIGVISAPGAIGLAKIPAYGALERNFQEQMEGLTGEQRGVVLSLKVKWERNSNSSFVFPNLWYLKFARCSPGEPFTFRTAWKSMKKYKRNLLDLTISNMEPRLRKKIVFPVKNLKSLEGNDMFYIRMSRFFPRKMSTSELIESLVYVMDCLLEKEQAQSAGIGLVANMTDWKMNNFTVQFFQKFLMTLQGKTSPTRIQVFLLVNPPSWFGSIWMIMKPMMTDGFRKKVHIVNFHTMRHHLAPGYEQFLPDDIYSGTADTDKIVNEFIELRKSVEMKHHARRKNSF